MLKKKVKVIRGLESLQMIEETEGEICEYRVGRLGKVKSSTRRRVRMMMALPGPWASLTGVSTDMTPGRVSPHFPIITLNTREGVLL